MEVDVPLLHDAFATFALRTFADDAGLHEIKDLDALISMCVHNSWEYLPNMWSAVIGSD